MDTVYRISEPDAIGAARAATRLSLLDLTHDCLFAMSAKSSHSIGARIKRLGDGLVVGFHLLGLFVIGGTVAWAAVHEYLRMMSAGQAGLDDILLLFIYLELGTMVGIYFKTDRLPVLFLLYIAITAMTRYLAVDVKSLPIEAILSVTATILMLALAVLVLQLAAARYSRDAEGSEVIGGKST